MTGRRAFLAGALTLPLAARAGEQWDAVVDPATGTLGAALLAAEKAGRPYRILLAVLAPNPLPSGERETLAK